MCGIEGKWFPTCETVSPFLNLAPTSKRPETNCEDAEASISIAPPSTSPWPWIENGRDSPETKTPSERSESMVVFIGRLRAAKSPSKSICPLASDASAGTNRMTVPANPQSIAAGPNSGLGVTTTVVPETSMCVPSLRRASIIREESRETRQSRRVVGLSARAERTNSRLFRDLDPGRLMIAASGFWVLGAAQRRE